MVYKLDCAWNGVLQCRLRKGILIQGPYLYLSWLSGPNIVIMGLKGPDIWPITICHPCIQDYICSTLFIDSCNLKIVHRNRGIPTMHDILQIVMHSIQCTPWTLQNCYICVRRWMSQRDRFVQQMGKICKWICHKRENILASLREHLLQNHGYLLCFNTDIIIHTHYLAHPHTLCSTTHHIHST